MGWKRNIKEGSKKLVPVKGFYQEIIKPKETRSGFNIFLQSSYNLYFVVKVASIISYSINLASTGEWNFIEHNKNLIQKIFNKKTIEQKVSETESFPDDKTYFYSGLKDNRKVYKE